MQNAGAMRQRELPDTLGTVNLVAQVFYEAVPLDLRTHCSLTARVAASVLQRLGIECGLLPCQLWYASPVHNLVVGFAGHAGAQQWDGHVVCAGRNWLMDTALHHLQRNAGIDVPDVAVVKRFALPAQVIARRDLSASERLWWYNPPPGADATPCEERADTVRRFADAVLGKLALVAH